MFQFVLGNKTIDTLEKLGLGRNKQLVVSENFLVAHDKYFGSLGQSSKMYP